MTSWIRADFFGLAQRHVLQQRKVASLSALVVTELLPPRYWYVRATGPVVVAAAPETSQAAPVEGKQAKGAPFHGHVQLLGFSP